MESCNFFKVKSIQLRSSSITLNRQQAHSRSKKCCWCSHPNSPVSEDVAIIGQDQHLKCDGDLDQCQITKEKFAEPFIKAK